VIGNSLEIICHMNDQMIPQDTQVSRLVTRTQILAKIFGFIDYYQVLCVFNSVVDKQANEVVNLQMGMVRKIWGSLVQCHNP
jgi:hypothetical protein